MLQHFTSSTAFLHNVNFTVHQQSTQRNFHQQPPFKPYTRPFIHTRSRFTHSFFTRSHEKQATFYRYSHCSRISCSVTVSSSSASLTNDDDNEGNINALIAVKAATNPVKRDTNNIIPKKAQKAVNQLTQALVKMGAAQPEILFRFFVATVMMLVSKFLYIIVPFLFKRATDLLANTAAPLPQWLPPFLLTHLNSPFGLLILYGALRATASLAHELRNTVFAKAGQRVSRNIARDTFSHLHSLDAAWHMRRKTGAVTRIVDRGTKSLITIFRSVFLSFVPTLLEFVLVCAVLATTLGFQFAIATLVVFVMYIAFTLYMNQFLIPIRIQMNDLDNEASSKAVDSLLNFETVKLYGNEHFEVARYDRCLKVYETAAVTNEKLYTALNAGQNAIFVIGLSMVLVLAAINVPTGIMTVGDLIMASSLLQQLWIPLQFIGWQYREIRQALTDMENLFNLLDIKSTINSPPDAPDLQVHGGEISFQDVCFAYKGSKSQLLNNLSFHIAPGKKLAIVGESGSGKSTALRLLYRLFEPSSGTITIDDQNIANVSLNSLRASIGMVPQDTILFNDTIYYNIAYGKPDSTREQVEQAAKLAQIHDKIIRMPKGYDTVVGERGLLLSGGEKQRVAIARCLLKNPAILLTDEATSALDTKTELDIIDALNQLGKNRTTIVVAHRLSTIIDADQILVMKNGQVVEKGNHKSLLGNPMSYYADMWSRQSTKKTDPVENHIVPSF